MKNNERRQEFAGYFSLYAHAKEGFFHFPGHQTKYLILIYHKTFTNRNIDNISVKKVSQLASGILLFAGMNIKFIYFVKREQETI
jgi:hypothetical protein